MKISNIGITIVSINYSVCNINVLLWVHFCFWDTSHNFMQNVRYKMISEMFMKISKTTRASEFTYDSGTLYLIFGNRRRRTRF